MAGEYYRLPACSRRKGTGWQPVLLDFDKLKFVGHSGLVLGHARIYFVGPGRDAALEIDEVARKP